MKSLMNWIYKFAASLKNFLPDMQDTSNLKYRSENIMFNPFMTNNKYDLLSGIGIPYFWYPYSVTLKKTKVNQNSVKGGE